ncbi:hypothetical protein [Microbispora triticiradicis]|nr:hypothetical protein [Microbispora fusca]
MAPPLMALLTMPTSPALGSVPLLLSITQEMPTAAPLALPVPVLMP